MIKGHWTTYYGEIDAVFRRLLSKLTLVPRSTEKKILSFFFNRRVTHFRKITITMIAKEIRNDRSDCCIYMCKLSPISFNYPSCVKFCIYTHPGNSKFTTWDSSQLANNNPTMPHQRQCQKSSPDLVLFSIFSDRASSTGIWITLYQIHYLRSIDLYIFTRRTIPTTWLKSNHRIRISDLPIARQTLYQLRHHGS